MKSFIVVLSAAVLAGLGGYFAFAACDVFRLLQNQVMVHVDVFVLLITAVALGSAFLAIVLRAALQRGEDRLVRRLEGRIAELERRGLDRPADVDVA
ncbi:MAG: hypothetical protein ACE37K_09085 [Planctomycetota bacterium]|jgi:hypothetical protein